MCLLLFFFETLCHVVSLGWSGTSPVTEGDLELLTLCRLHLLSTGMASILFNSHLLYIVREECLDYVFVLPRTEAQMAKGIGLVLKHCYVKRAKCSQ